MPQFIKFGPVLPALEGVAHDFLWPGDSIDLKGVKVSNKTSFEGLFVTGKRDFVPSVGWGVKIQVLGVENSKVSRLFDPAIMYRVDMNHAWREVAIIIDCGRVAIEPIPTSGILPEGTF